MPQKRKTASASSRDTPISANKKQKQKSSPAEIVGGFNGDYRITGNERTSSLRTFTVPSGKNDDKVIPCQERQPSTSTSTGGPTLIFTHGAGGGLENPATKHFADGYGASSDVVCFQGTMNLQSRVRNFETVIEDTLTRLPKQDTAVAVGGRSMGARAAVMVAQERVEVKKLVLVSYPLTGQNGDLRDRILLDLPEDKEVLFLVGDEDGMCDLGELEKVRKKMTAQTCVIVVKGADHGMSLKLTGKGLGKEEKERIVERVRRWTGRVAAEWVLDMKTVMDGQIIDWEKLDTDDSGSKQEDDNKDKGKEDHGSGKKDMSGESQAVMEEKADASTSRRSKRRKK